MLKAQKNSWGIGSNSLTEENEHRASYEYELLVTTTTIFEIKETF